MTDDYATSASTRVEPMADKNHKDVLNSEYLEGTFHKLTGRALRRACRANPEAGAMIFALPDVLCIGVGRRGRPSSRQAPMKLRIQSTWWQKSKEGRRCQPATCRSRTRSRHPAKTSAYARAP
jgi:hypothetical protein